MFHKILVPLDGSDRAQRALPIAARIARANNATIVLVRVIYPAIEYTRFATYAFVSDEMNDKINQEELELADKYLKQCTKSEELHGLPIETFAASNVQVADEILEIASRNKIDLIVMCSHGYSGLKRWALGSVATKLTLRSTVPILVLHSAESSETQIYTQEQTQHIMVPLDGSELSETALRPALDLGRALSAPNALALHLIKILPLPAPNLVERLQNFDEKKARERVEGDTLQYLEGVKERLLSEITSGPKPLITTTVMIRNDVATALVEAARQNPSEHEQLPFEHIDTIALTTHGRSGIQRWAMGSIALRILETSRTPLFVVHAPKENQKKEVPAAEEKKVAR